MITIYGFDPDGDFQCKPCIKAKMLADARKFNYVFKGILKEGTSPESSQYKKELTDLRKSLGLALTGFTMPQVFIGNQLIGGFDEFKDYASKI